MSSTYRLFNEKLGGSNPSAFVGTLGDIFYNPTTGALRVSDGVTAGGVSRVLAEASAGIQVTKLLHVDGSRTDDYLETGSILTPFTSIQSALNVAIAGTTISVAPGTYQENIIIPDLDGLAIIGSSEMNTNIINNGNNHTITWVPGATAGALVNTFALKFFTVTNTLASYKALHVDAAAVLYPNNFCGDEFDITEVDFDGVQGAGNANMYFRNTGIVYWNHGDCVGGDLFIDTCSSFRTRNVEIGTLAAPMNVKTTYEGATDIHNLMGRTDYSFGASTVIFGNLNIFGHPVVQLDTSSVVIGNIVATSLTSFYASGRDYCPLFSIYGQVGLAGGGQGNITITFPDPQTSGSAFNAVDLSNAHIQGIVTLLKTNFLPATARGYAVVLGQAQYDKGTASSISVNGFVSLDLKGATYAQAALSGTGFVDRNVITFVNATVATTPGTTLTISPPLPTGATYSAVATPTSAITTFITTKTTSSLKLVGSAGGFADVTITRI